MALLHPVSVSRLVLLASVFLSKFEGIVAAHESVDKEEIYAQIAFEATKEPPGTNVQAGVPFTITIQINLPDFKTAPTTGIVVDVFGYDIRGSAYTRYALYDPQVIVSNDVTIGDEMLPKLNRSAEFTNVYHSASFVLKQVTSTSSTGTIIIKLKATAVRSAQTTSGGQYSLLMGATYGAGLFGWAEQGKYTVDTSDVALDFLGSVESWSSTGGEIPARGADRLDIVASYTNPFDILKIEVEGSSSAEDIFTLSPIETQQIGYSFWECGAFLNDLNATEMTASSSGLTNQTAKRDFGAFLNCGGEQPRTAHVDDQITLSVGLFTDGQPGDTVSLIVRLLLRGEAKLTQTVSLTLSSSDASAVSFYQKGDDSVTLSLAMTDPDPGIPTGAVAGSHVSLDLRLRFPAPSVTVGQQRNTVATSGVESGSSSSGGSGADGSTTAALVDSSTAAATSTDTTTATSSGGWYEYSSGFSSSDTATTTTTATITESPTSAADPTVGDAGASSTEEDTGRLPVSYFYKSLIVTGTQAEPCGVVPGPAGISVSPLWELQPHQHFSVFPVNSSMVVTTGAVFYTGLMAYKAPEGSEDGDLVVRLSVWVPETATSPKVTVTVAGTSNTVEQAISLATGPSSTASRAFAMEGNITSILPNLVSTSTVLYMGGAVGFNVSLFVPPGASYGALQLTAAPYTYSGAQMRVCSARLLEVGASLPCTRYRADDINASLSILGSHAHSLPNRADINLGKTCSMPVLSRRGIQENIITASFVFQHVASFGPNNTFMDATASNPFWFNTYATGMGAREVFAAKVSYTTSSEKTLLKRVPDSSSKQAWASVRSGSPLRPGQTALVDIYIKAPPGSIADNVIKATAPDSASQVKFCDVRVTSVGANYACQRDAAYRRLFHYRTYDSPESDYMTLEKSSNGIHTVTAHLMRYANTEPSDWNYQDDTTADDDTVVASLAVSVPDNIQQTTLTFDVKLSESADNQWKSLTVQLPVVPEPSGAVPAAPQLTYVVDTPGESQDWSVFPGVMKQLEVTLQLESGFSRRVKLELETTDATPRYDACCAYVTTVGENSPCVDATNLQSEVSSTVSGQSGQDTLTFDMGRLCAVPLIPESAGTNQVKVVVGLRPRSDLGAGEAFTVNLKVMLDDSTAASGRIAGGSLSANNGTDPITVTLTTASSGFTGTSTPGSMRVVKYLRSDNELIGMTETTWLKYAISLPRPGVGRASLRWIGLAEDDRAVIVPTGRVRIIFRGRNVPCFGVGEIDDMITLSSTVSSGQDNVVTLDLGYVTNTGMTMSRPKDQDWEEDDDTVQFEAEFQFTDHPRSTHGTLLPVHLKIEWGTIKRTSDHEISLKRTGTEMPRMELGAFTPVVPPYQRNEQVPVDLWFSHSSSSSADAVNVTLLVALPPFITFDAVTWSNFSTAAAVARRRYGVELSWPLVMRHQSVHLKLQLTVDPDNMRGFGAGYSAATTPLQLRATMFRRYGIESQPYGMYPPEGTLWYSVATPSYITFDVNSEECFSRLGVTSGLLADCQLSASSAADAGRAPQMARMSSCADAGLTAADVVARNFSGYAGDASDPLPCADSTGWSPEQRGAPFQHWHQVDFGNMTRVTGVLVAAPTGTRRVLKFRLQYSLTGSSFQDATETTRLYWSSARYGDGVLMYKLEEAVEARYVRFVIDKAEPGDDRYIGLQVDYLGCLRTTDFPQSEVCAAQPSTPLADDASRNRHFSVDTANNYIYFCDFIQSRGRRVCFVSYDASQWTRLPEHVERVRGFDESSGRIYVSGALAGSLMWSSDGAATWFPETEAELSTLARSEGFFAAQEVPALTPDAVGFSGKSIGDWAASYDGLSLSGQLRVKWSAIDCSA